MRLALIPSHRGPCHARIVACRGALFVVQVVAMLVVMLIALGCETSARVGTYTEAGVRCDPLSDTACGASSACVLDADPSLDACRPVMGLPLGTACDATNACAATTQCAAFDTPDSASIAADDLGAGVCARVCARDVPACESDERCLSIRASSSATSGVRVDYGVCARR